MTHFHSAVLSEDTVEQLGLKSMVDEETDFQTESQIYIGSFTTSDRARDGEELEFGIELLKRVSQLKNGELLIVAVDRF